VGFVGSETGSCSEACVTCDVDGTEEDNIKSEESIDIKDEFPEVRLWGVCVCEMVAAHAFRPFIAP
jgi:hypothetical protein